ncbi:MAG: deoxycytidine triphosphate deaminase [Halobacteriales archaeon]|jgi:deoxycytidine triphosphate deaminase
MTTEGLLERVDGLLHEDTQVHDAGVDLTVTEIYTVTDPGRVDFGGGELDPAGLTPHERVWRDDNDDYQWWHLVGGTYLLEYNESLATDEPVVLQPRDAILERGATHPTLRVTELGRVPLTVPDAGIKIKENARVSTIVADPH